jgi:thymidylate synthase ThyX
LYPKVYSNQDSQVYAQVIKDSVSPQGHRLTTIEARFARFVLAELNTHRVFSRNSASSRAIPVHKQITQVQDSPMVPVEWRKEQSGMQGGDHIVGWEADMAQKVWVQAMEQAVANAETLVNIGVHKSIVNRLLEPFMYHTVIITATEWDGFFNQRCSPLAQPEIRVAAETMLAAYNASTPNQLNYGQWHLPYIDQEDTDAITAGNTTNSRITAVSRQVSAARCARVSYLTHDGHRSIEADIKLYNRLVGARPMHSSPLEHVATPTVLHAPGNFTGWYQLRHEVEQNV